METRLIIVRHGNTFDKEDIVLRVGANTDLPLSKSGWQQAEDLGNFLQKEQLIPDLVFCSNLKRTIQTAEKIIKVIGLNITAKQGSMFNEVDYGPDEGKPESQVIKRLGERTLRDWEERFIVPDGWKVNCAKIQANWLVFAKRILSYHQGNTILVVTSGGIARFASFLSESLDSFKQKYHLKLTTGSASLLINNDKDEPWQVKFWNKVPIKK